MESLVKIRNTFVYHNYYARLKEIAVTLFEWHNLPKTCNARFLENCLFHYGKAVFVEDPEMSFLNLKVTPASTLNVYNEALAYNAFSMGYSKLYDADECVIIRNNLLEKSTDSTIILLAERLSMIQLAIDVNINAQRTPVLIRCEEKTLKSLRTIYEKYTGNMPVIFSPKSFDPSVFAVLKTDAPFVADKLREEKTAVWNEALEFLGLNTNPSDKKKERLIVNEVDANNEQIEIQSYVMLSARQKACDEINEKFGLNVSVTRRIFNEKPAVKEGENVG